MKKFIIFDLDGVLIEAKNIHYESLNKALGPNYKIDWHEHIALYDGLKTRQKLNMLTTRKGLPKDLHDVIWKNKQKYTSEMLLETKESPTLISTFQKLKSDGYILGVCSNSIRSTVEISLQKLGIIDYFSIILSNEDVQNSKPHPEIYWKAMACQGFLPEETLIIEDSPYGLLAAHRSSASVLRVKNPSDVFYENIVKNLNNTSENEMTYPKWKDEKLNVLIPMAGAGTRFQKAGYTFPKPLIEVRGKPMIQVVIENLNIDANYIFIVQKEHDEKWNIKSTLKLLSPNCKIVEVDQLTEGAACTVLLAKEHINNNAPLFMANSDQFVEWNSNEFMYKMNENNADGGIVTFEATHPKWSYAKVGDDGYVTEVAEKNPISNNATVGFYYWKNGSDFVKFAEQMIEKNIRVNNEFYVCPVFNEAIGDGRKIKTFEASKMWGLGTPEDLNYFVNNHGK